jgi:hypothetical protein
MDFSTLVSLLQSHAEFHTISEWVITRVESGITSPHKYRFQSQHADYFIKEITVQEQNALRLLHTHQLRIAPPLPYPDLLEQMILVTTFFPGGCNRDKTLPLTLLTNYAEMQNTLNREDVLLKPDRFNSNHSNEQDRGFYRRTVADNPEEWKQNLHTIQRYNLPVVDSYLALANKLDNNRQRIAEDFAAMPFGWLHNDFRLENFVGTPPVVMDWGSSYGHGPFLYDLAPFLLNDDVGFAHFIRHSHNCRNVSPDRLKRWLYVAGWASFMGFLRWFLVEGVYWNGREECDAYMTDAYQTWQALEADQG